MLIGKEQSEAQICSRAGPQQESVVDVTCVLKVTLCCWRHHPLLTPVPSRGFPPKVTVERIDRKSNIDNCSTW
eukprot:679038-Amphidinium_carterae.2